MALPLFGLRRARGVRAEVLEVVVTVVAFQCMVVVMVANWKKKPLLKRLSGFNLFGYLQLK